MKVYGKRFLGRYTWEELKEHRKNGTIGEILESGDQIPVTLKDGEEVVFDVTYDETGKIFFVLHDCLAEEHCMNEKCTNEGGWAASDMRKWLNTEVLSRLPDDLQAVIEPTHIVQVLDGERIECDDKLFLLSATQVFGRAARWNKQEPEDYPLDIFTTERSRVKECGDNGTWFWWLRRANSNNVFNSVYSVGGSGNYYAYNTYGVALGFSI